MGRFHVFVKDLLHTDASITIHCYCLRTAVWTQTELTTFSPGTRLWSATETFICSSCGRRGKVRDIDVHDGGTDPHELTKPERIRKPIALKQKRTFGKRASPPKQSEV